MAEDGLVTMASALLTGQYAVDETYCDAMMEVMRAQKLVEPGVRQGKGSPAPTGNVSGIDTSAMEDLTAKMAAMRPQMFVGPTSHLVTGLHPHHRNGKGINSHTDLDSI